MGWALAGEAGRGRTLTPLSSVHKGAQLGQLGAKLTGLYRPCHEGLTEGSECIQGSG